MPSGRPESPVCWRMPALTLVRTGCLMIGPSGKVHRTRMASEAATLVETVTQMARLLAPSLPPVSTGPDDGTPIQKSATFPVAEALRLSRRLMPGADSSPDMGAAGDLHPHEPVTFREESGTG